MNLLRCLPEVVVQVNQPKNGDTAIENKTEQDPVESNLLLV